MHCFFVHEELAPTGVYWAKLSRIRGSVRRWNGRKPSGEYVTKPEALFDSTLLTRVWGLEQLQEAA